MALNDLFRRKEDSNVDPTGPNTDQGLLPESKEWLGKEIDGKIIKVGAGWGFISTPKVPYTRVFFHWTSLVQDTLNFRELEKGMKVLFTLVYKEGRGYSGVKIRVDESELEPIDAE